MKNILSKWPILVVVLMVGCLAWLGFANRRWPEQMIVVNDRLLKVLVADTYSHQFEGWSNKSTMMGYDGMLFVFPFESEHAMVMRDMAFPLDMVWLNKGMIVDLAPNAQPEPGRKEAELTVYRSRLPDMAVLELKAGLIHDLNLKIGDQVTLIDR